MITLLNSGTDYIFTKVIDNEPLNILDIQGYLTLPKK